MRVENVILPTRGSHTRWDIEVADGIIRTVQPSSQTETESETEAEAGTGAETCGPSILVPALCHPHVHLDKAYILTCNCVSSGGRPDYSDLVPTSGTFGEALSNTSRAKERYTEHDLYLRGSQLLATSYRQGVTSLRAFVELDHVTGVLPLTTAIRLKQEFSHLMEVQICAFAQDPIFSTEHGDSNRAVITEALGQYASDIGALGTTPYVEMSSEASLRNVDWAITTAMEHGIHLDFHLDYNLDPPGTSTPLTYSVIEMLQSRQWTRKADRSKTIVLGHCTQLTTLPNADLAALAHTIRSSELPIHFVGLPTSDMFMMGRPNPDSETGAAHHRPRGTLQIPALINDLGLSACLGVNNVGNAFTPYGTGDPLQLASLGVGIYQAGTTADATTLYSCVSWRARKAIGLDVPRDSGDVTEGSSWQPMLLVGNEKYMTLSSKTGQNKMIKVPVRQRVGFSDIVWDPPEVRLRSIVR